MKQPMRGLWIVLTLVTASSCPKKTEPGQEDSHGSNSPIATSKECRERLVKLTMICEAVDKAQAERVVDELLLRNQCGDPEWYRQRFRDDCLPGSLVGQRLRAELDDYWLRTAKDEVPDESDGKARGVAGIASLDGASLKVTVSMPKKPRRDPSDDGDEGGTNEPKNLRREMSDDGDGLDMGSIYSTYSRQGSGLGGCLQRTGAGQASIGMIIDGASGRVTLVKVDGKQSGGTWACLNGVLRDMQFPKLKGGRTRAEFDIGI